jgi:hypothetical protein
MIACSTTANTFMARRPRLDTLAPAGAGAEARDNPAGLAHFSQGVKRAAAARRKCAGRAGRRNAAPARLVAGNAVLAGGRCGECIAAIRVATQCCHLATKSTPVRLPAGNSYRRMNDFWLFARSYLRNQEHSGK